MVVVENGRILSVGPPTIDVVAKDLGHVALVPGLVNAHTHLEFSDLDAPLGAPGMALPDWIGLVVARRRALAAEHEADIADYVEESMRRGLAECFAGGTALLGEIASFVWPRDVWNDAPLDGVVFQEILGLDPEAAQEQLIAAAVLLDSGETPWQKALSPHAPYTVSLSTVAEVAELARRAGVPCAMHLAESREEIELLANGGGPFRTVLERFNAWNDAIIPRGTRPLDFLQRLAAAPRTLAIHGNYFDDAEWKFLASRRETMSLVHCPRTHAFFQHPPLPLRQVLDRGVRVALGTDSRASNPDLGLLAEMRFLAGQANGLSGAEILHAGTLGGATALGQAARHGSLEPGKAANMLAIVLDKKGRNADPHDLLFGDDRPPIAVMRAGEWHAV